MSRVTQVLDFVRMLDDEPSGKRMAQAVDGDSVGKSISLSSFRRCLSLNIIIVNGVAGVWRALGIRKRALSDSWCSDLNH